jgi:hypothetical protein
LTAQRLATGALCFVALCSFAACTSETPEKTSTTSTTKESKTATTTSTAPQTASTWVQQWQPTLIGTYGTAQSAFLTAVSTRQPASIQAAAQPLAAANTALQNAIKQAGPPPADDAASATLAMLALTSEAQLLQTIQTVCTGPTEACTNTLAAYAKNQQKLIVLFTDLGAAS